MNPILLATDYSEAAHNAGNFAAALAKACDTSLIVLHAWTPPVANSEAGALPPDLDELTRIETEAVKAEAARLSKQYEIATKAIQRMDFVPSSLAAETWMKEVSLVVMGMSKHSAIGEFFGSVATTNLHKAAYPVLIIPEGCTFHVPQTLLFATDLDGTESRQGLALLKRMAELFHAALQIVHVREHELQHLEEAGTHKWIDQKLSKLQHEWHFPEGKKSVDKTILEEAKQAHADWVAVAPRRMAWYEALFHRSVSRRLAFEIDRPLLVFPAI